MPALPYTRTSGASVRGRSFDTRLQWLWQIILALIIFSASGAGYYSQDIYAQYLRTGAIAVNADTDGNPLAVIGTLASIAAILMLPFYSIRKTPAVVVGFFLFQIYIVVSGFWSFVPGATIGLVIKTCIYVAALTTLVQRMSYRSIVISLSGITIIIAIVSLYLSFTNPIFAISLGTPGWRGLFSHKNRLAGFCLFMIILLAPAYYFGVRKRLVLFTLGLLGITLILSQGKTAIAATAAFIVASTCLIFIAKRRGGVSLIYRHSTATLFFLIIIVLPFVAIVAIAGDITFTGRVETWDKFLLLTTDNRLLGLGGYTISADAKFSAQATLATGAPTPDSSIISVLCNFGVVGLTLYFIFMGYCWREALRRFNIYSLYCFFTVLIYAIYGAMESDAQLGLSFSTVTLLAQMLISQRIFDGSKTSTIKQDPAAGPRGNGGRRSQAMRDGSRAA